MLRKEVTVKDIDKKYDHPLAEIVQIASQFKSEILLEYDKYRINAKSIMGIIAFNPSEGMSVDIVTDGSDEMEALLGIPVVPISAAKNEGIDELVEHADKLKELGLAGEYADGFGFFTFLPVGLICAFVGTLILLPFLEPNNARLSVNTFLLRWRR